MSVPLAILIALTAATPAIIIVDGDLARGVVLGAVAAALAFIALAMSDAEIRRFRRAASGFALVAVAPLAYMLTQIAPLPFAANAAWRSAAAALGRDVAATISVDIGATALAATHYLLLAAIALAAAALALDRRRATSILAVLTVETTVIAATLLVHDAAGFSLLGFAFDGWQHDQAFDCACFGLILALASAKFVAEAEETRRGAAGVAILAAPAFLGCLVAVLTCAAAIVAAAGSLAWIAFPGALAFLIVIIARRLGFGSLSVLAIVGVAVAASVILAGRPSFVSGDPTLALASPQPSLAVTDSVLRDSRSPWGTGAGTFAEIAALYVGAAQSASRLPATSAATLAVEMGRPFLIASLAVAILLIVELLRAAVSRGRDSFFALAGACAAMTSLLIAASNSGLSGTAPLMILSVTLGLGVGQRLSSRAPA